MQQLRYKMLIDGQTVEAVEVERRGGVAVEEDENTIDFEEGKEVCYRSDPSRPATETSYSLLLSKALGSEVKRSKETLPRD